MTGIQAHANEQRVLILAPFGRDAVLAVQILQRAGIHAVAVASVDQLIEEIRSGVGAIMVAGDTLDLSSHKSLSECIAAQPPWSDIPIILLTSEVKSQERAYTPTPPFDDLGNVTFLPRPSSVRTVAGVVRFALRSRSHQYRMRELLLQLDETTQDLARSNSELEAFAYTAAHDLREPLRMIESYLGVVIERFATALGEAGMRYVGNVSSASCRMRKLLQALLAYAHAGNSALVATPVSLKAVVTVAIKNLSNSISRSSGDVMIKSDDSLVQGDEALLTELLQNLIGNGLKYHKPDVFPHIEVAWTVDCDHWSCSVRDNGIGIPPEAQERVFTVFQRLHGIGDYPGTGIGLATCRRIVDRHGGRIWVESEVGVGSTFHVAIPTKLPQPAPAAPPLGVAV